MTRAEFIRHLVLDAIYRSGEDLFSDELCRMPLLDTVEEHLKTYFHITHSGVTVHEGGGSWWPFDHDGTLRPDWRLVERL